MPILTALVAEWLWPLIFSIARHLTAVGSSLARVTWEASQVLLAGACVFSRGSPFIALAQNE